MTGRYLNLVMRCMRCLKAWNRRSFHAVFRLLGNLHNICHRQLRSVSYIPLQLLSGDHSRQARLQVFATMNCRPLVYVRLQPQDAGLLLVTMYLSRCCIPGHTVATYAHTVHIIISVFRKSFSLLLSHTTLTCLAVDLNRSHRSDRHPPSSYLYVPWI